MRLTDDDVRDILHLLDDLRYDELHLTTESFTLTLRRAGAGGWTQTHQSLSSPVMAQQPAPAQVAPRADTAPAPDREAAEDDGRQQVRAPLPGTFYRSPKPGAPPFVEVGDHVEEDTVVGIIEVMKLMNSVHAGVRGKVVEIRPADAEVTAQDAVLMLVEVETP